MPMVSVSKMNGCAKFSFSWFNSKLCLLNSNILIVLNSKFLMVKIPT